MPGEASLELQSSVETGGVDNSFPDTHWGWECGVRVGDSRKKSKQHVQRLRVLRKHF